jgi:putative oxidoreductase
MRKLLEMYEGLEYAFLRYLAPVVVLSARLCIGYIFFRSAMVALGDMNATVFLFREEFNVPLLPPVFAAYLSTILELGFGAALIIGLMTRLSAFVLVLMTLVIDLTYQTNIQHSYWALVLGLLMVTGSSRLSLDALICDKTKRELRK